LSVFILRLFYRGREMRNPLGNLSVIRYFMYGLCMVCIVSILVIGSVGAQKSLPQEDETFTQYQQQTTRALQMFVVTQYMCSIKVFSPGKNVKNNAVIEIITASQVPPDSIQVRYLDLLTNTWSDPIIYKHCSTANRASNVR